MHKTEQNAQDDYPHWGRVYAAVVLTTVVVVVLLWLFPRWFAL